VGECGHPVVAAAEATARWERLHREAVAAEREAEEERRRESDSWYDEYAKGETREAARRAWEAETKARAATHPMERVAWDVSRERERAQAEERRQTAAWEAWEAAHPAEGMAEQ